MKPLKHFLETLLWNYQNYIFFFFLTTPRVMWDLLRPGIEPVPPELEVKNLPVFFNLFFTFQIVIKYT